MKFAKKFKQFYDKKYLQKLINFLHKKSKNFSKFLQNNFINKSTYKIFKAKNIF